MNLYFDNASTSFPKPKMVSEAVTNYIEGIGATYGRAAYGRVVEAVRIVEGCRDLLAKKIGTSLNDNIAFTYNATYAINTILKGVLHRGDRVLVSAMEHNAVMRPLEKLRQDIGIKISIMPSFEDGLIDLSRLKSCIGKDTSLIVINHQSNVNGIIQPLENIRSCVGDIPIMVDATQSLGAENFMADKWGIDYVAFTGHKALMGIMGIGGFFVRNPDILTDFVQGGTGSNSEKFEMPDTMPDKYEAGTPNIPSIAGLYAALSENIEPLHKRSDFIDLLSDVSSIKGITVYSAENPDTQGELFSFTHDSIMPSMFAKRLFSEYEIEIRQGLHCSPLAHKTMGTFPNGTIRIAPSVFHTKEDLKYLFNAIENISK